MPVTFSPCEWVWVFMCCAAAVHVSCLFIMRGESYALGKLVSSFVGSSVQTDHAQHAPRTYALQVLGITDHLHVVLWRILTFGGGCVGC
jgi:hypothetical protein